jgi:hypothetical protein
MLIGYARVSTHDQNLELQREALTKARCEKIFEDKVSGTQADGPGLAKALEILREDDTLVVRKLDRLGYWRIAESFQKSLICKCFEILFGRFHLAFRQSVNQFMESIFCCITHSHVPFSPVVSGSSGIHPSLSSFHDFQNLSMPITGLQIRCGGVKAFPGGFDSHALPPTYKRDQVEAVTSNIKSDPKVTW